MSLVVAAVLAALAASAGFFVSRRRPTSSNGGSIDPRDPGAAELASDAGRDAFDGLPLELGDVVSVEGEERWLAGALIARDRGKVICALFIAPEGMGQAAVAAFASPRREIHWLAPVSMEAPDEPPATIEIAGVTLRRRGRVPVTLERLGQGVPPVGDTALWAAYEGGGRDVALVVTSGGQAFAWAGKRYDRGEYDRLGTAPSDDR